MDATASSASRRALVRILFLAAILLAVGLATVPLDRDAVAPAPGQAPPAVAGAPDVRPRDASVPAASDVFTGRHAVVEHDAPTF